MIEAVSFVGGAALGAVFGALLEAIIEIKEEAGMFKPLLNEIMSTLESWEPVLKKIEELNRELVHKGNVATSLISKMEKGTKLVSKCNKIHPCNIYKRIAYTRKFISLKYSLKKLFKELQLEQVADIREMLLLSRSMHSSISRMEGSGKVYSQIEMKGSCVVPAPSSFTVGLDVPLRELKLLLFNDGKSVHVVTAPGGCGKTTLASIFCFDHDVKEKFGNIFFVNISKTPSLIEIVEMICPQMGNQGSLFQNEEAALNCFFEHLLKQKEQGTLLVFDDAKPGSESLLEKFIRQVPNYKIMVTSRSELLPVLASTYHLSSLHIKDAMTLFRHSASLENGSYEIPDDLVKKIVERLKEFPLALKVVGRSLRGKRVEIWQRKLKECSKGSSILNSEEQLLGCLKSSLDELGKENLKECFMDLGSFPEDQRIPAVALIDMWRELYEIEEDALAIANLIDLTNQSLANLVVTRKDVQEVDGYYSEHFVVQHDLLRELAIYESSKDKVGQRKRLMIDVSGDNMSWKEEEQPINARLVSISTADAFSSKWCDMQLPKAEVLVLNLRTKNYGLPGFVGKMEKLKVLVVTNYTFIPAEISSFHLLGFLPNLKRIRLERISIPSLTKTLVQLKNLQKVSLFMCSIGQAFSDCSIQISDVFPNLVEMNIDYCKDLAELPAGFCDMVNLKKLSITHCHKLSSLPEDIGKLENLEVLRLRSCIDLIELPESTCKLSKLNFLDISNCFSLQSLPEHIGELYNLKKLNMKDCSRVQELPPSIFDLEHLKEVICDEEMKDFWESFFPDSSSFINIKLAKEDINLNWLCNLQY